MVCAVQTDIARGRRNKGGIRDSTRSHSPGISTGHTVAKSLARGKEKTVQLCYLPTLSCTLALEQKTAKTSLSSLLALSARLDATDLCKPWRAASSVRDDV